VTGARMYTIAISGEATPPWSQLLDVWRLLAAATFPPPAVTATAESQPCEDAPPLFNEFKQWARSKGLCRYAAQSLWQRYAALVRA
jgi:hypothetical protein